MTVIIYVIHGLAVIGALDMPEVAPRVSCPGEGVDLQPETEVDVAIWLTLAGQRHEDRLKPILRRVYGNPASEFKLQFAPVGNCPEEHNFIRLRCCRSTLNQETNFGIRFNPDNKFQSYQNDENHHT